MEYYIILDIYISGVDLIRAKLQCVNNKIDKDIFLFCTIGIYEYQNRTFVHRCN